MKNFRRTATRDSAARGAANHATVAVADDERYGGPAVTSVLIVEDEESLADPLAFLLRKEGFETTVVTDGPSALAEFDRAGADIVLLDLMLPGMSGTDVCKQLRSRSGVPVIMVTARDSEIDKVVGLELGADDYVTKPFSFAILVARLRALVRRGAAARPTVLEAGDLRLDPAAHHVWRGDTPISLTAREFAVLEHLMRHRGQVLSKRDLIAGVWDDDFDGDPNIVEVYVGHLRRKVDKPFGRAAIETIRGAGYRLAADGG